MAHFFGEQRSKSRFSLCVYLIHVMSNSTLSGLMGVAVFILIPGFLTCDQIGVAIMCLCLCTLFEGAGITGGYSCNAIDIAPRYDDRNIMLFISQFVYNNLESVSRSVHFTVTLTVAISKSLLKCEVYRKLSGSIFRGCRTDLFSIKAITLNTLVM